MSSSALKPSLKPSIKKTQTPGVNRDDNPRKKRLSVKFSQNTEVRVITASPRRHHHSRSSPGATVLSSAEFIALKNGDGSARAVEGSSDSSTDDVINDYICQFSDGENTERRVRLLNSGEDASLIDDIINGDNSDDATSMFNISSAPSLGQVADFYEPTQKVDIKGLKKVFGDSGDDSSLGIDSPGGGGGGGDVTSALGLAAPTLTDVAGFYEPTQNPSKKDLENAFKNDVEKEKKSKEKKAKNKKKKSLESAELSGIQTNILNVTDSSTDSSVLLNAPPSLTDVAGFYEQTQKPTKKELKKAFQGKERKRKFKRN